MKNPFARRRVKETIATIMVSRTEKRQMWLSDAKTLHTQGKLQRLADIRHGYGPLRSYRHQALDQWPALHADALALIAKFENAKGPKEPSDLSGLPDGTDPVDLHG